MLHASNPFALEGGATPMPSDTFVLSTGVFLLDICTQEVISYLQIRLVVLARLYPENLGGCLPSCKSLTFWGLVENPLSAQKVKVSRSNPVAVKKLNTLFGGVPRTAPHGQNCRRPFASWPAADLAAKRRTSSSCSCCPWKASNACRRGGNQGNPNRRG